MALTARERFMKHITIHEPTGCWLWTGHRSPSNYGRIAVRRPDGANSGRMAHKVVWEALTGRTVPPGLTLDHRCHTEDLKCRGGSSCWHRRCVNPEHMAGPMTQGENNRLATERRALQVAR